MIHSISEYVEQTEKIIIGMLIKHIEEAIKEGILPDDVIASEIYNATLSLIRIIIIESKDNNGQPKITDYEHLTAFAYFMILSILNKDPEDAKLADQLGKKYELIISYSRKIHDQIINKDYSDYELNATTLPTPHGAKIPLNLKAFIEKFRARYPLGYPNDYEDYEKIIDRFVMRDSQLTNTFEFTKKLYSHREEAKKHLLNIPTKANPEEILEFWLRLTGNNEKGEPYWESEKEIEHFVYQNFDIFPGVDEIITFNPNMNKSELSHVTWTFFHNYGTSKTKKQYEHLLMQNFTKFKNGRNVYSNIKDHLNIHLKELLK